jgi:hypothetical protein
MTCNRWKPCQNFPPLSIYPFSIMPFFGLRLPSATTTSPAQPRRSKQGREVRGGSWDSSDVMEPDPRSFNSFPPLYPDSRIPRLLEFVPPRQLIEWRGDGKKFFGSMEALGGGCILHCYCIALALGRGVPFVPASLRQAIGV